MPQVTWNHAPRFINKALGFILPWEEGSNLESTRSCDVSKFSSVRCTYLPNSTVTNSGSVMLLASMVDSPICLDTVEMTLKVNTAMIDSKLTTLYPSGQHILIQEAP